MRVLVIGSGGREHALVKAMKTSTLVSRVFAWPGNAGIFLDAEPLPSEVRSHQELGLWAGANKIALAVVGPESELVRGVSDILRANGVAVFGPSQQAAQLEASKIFAKDFMFEFNVPTARAVVVESVAATLKAVADSGFAAPYVLKADGLASGKGVFICSNIAELSEAARDIFEKHKLGDAGRRALLEEFQPGREISVLVLTNGDDYEVLPYGRDHKRLLSGDRGPNTGGMGVIAPINIGEALDVQIRKTVIDPTLRGLRDRKFLYRGVVFVGVMLTARGPQVLEYNVRFGDPETQAILPLLDGDWAQTLKAVAEGSVPKLKWRSDSTACIVVAAEGYPDNPVKGVPIPALKPTAAPIPAAVPSQTATAAASAAIQTTTASTVQIIHAGTNLIDGQFVTAGGRVLNVVARAPNLDLALKQAYAQLNQIVWPGAQWRDDIGKIQD